SRSDGVDRRPYRRVSVAVPGEADGPGARLLRRGALPAFGARAARFVALGQSRASAARQAIDRRRHRTVRKRTTRLEGRARVARSDRVPRGDAIHVVCHFLAVRNANIWSPTRDLLLVFRTCT